MRPKPRLVIGTANPKKGQELAELFAPVGLKLQTLADYPYALKIEETGETLAENARLKASVQAKHLGVWVLADDSGLSVDALGGAPGALSARYTGPNATDQSNNQRLLEELALVPAEQRAARFVCHMALSDPLGRIRAEAEGHCCGRIAFAPRGTAGFGYDPLFEIREYHRTFGELDAAVKSVLSHRARAAGRMIPQLMALVDSGQWGHHA